MKYVEYVNRLVRERIAACDEPVVCMGQNITAGSCLSGLTRGVAVKRGLVINSTNTENALAGIGFGLMMGGANGILFLKQQDFLLLGIDPLVNTYNYVRTRDPETSFTIAFLIVDQGYQGLQSSLNNMGDFCSIARIQGHTVTTKAEADAIIGKELISPGFRLIGVSQRLFGEQLIEDAAVEDAPGVFRYAEGERCTVACFNCSLPYGRGLAPELGASLFSVTRATPTDWSPILADAKRTGRLVVIDDSKSANRSCDDLLAAAEGIPAKRLVRELGPGWLAPNHERLEVDLEALKGFVGNGRR